MATMTDPIPSAVDQQELKNGDEIILGKFRLVYFDNKAVIAG